jgi:hypothetical protein
MLALTKDKTTLKGVVLLLNDTIILAGYPAC